MAHEKLIEEARAELQYLVDGLTERERELAEFEIRKMIDDLDEGEEEFFGTYPDIKAGLRARINLTSERLTRLQSLVI